MSKNCLQHDFYSKKEQIAELLEILFIVQFCLFRASTLGLLPDDVKHILSDWKSAVDLLIIRFDDLPF